ncbi:agmatine deiminase [Mycoplasma sp. SG1]|uniref:agmatine deiminase n=1 Tax=Mycoplasma sp. SG1 TaxID=2810348 RepID=UPI002023FE52|nr:agmatine deiminase [Mycoplasma sp. SG1]URM52742.1 agmatine deiminase [Mycoplasma sp. SG1]
MNNNLKSNPKEDGFSMPIETAEHERCWMIWPERTDNWRHGAKPAQKVFTKVANTIAKYETVVMLVSNKQYENARFHLDKKVKVIEMSNNDAWMRDIGPTFVRNEKTGEVRGVNWIFNSWGGINEGLYFPWDDDNNIAHKVCSLIDYEYYNAPLVLEGGSIHSDGDGTVYVTAECLLNKNRNPDLTKAEITNHLKNYLGVEKVLWIPRGVYNDETSGHVDNVIQIIEPGHVLLTWTDDQKDPQYQRSLEAYNFLTSNKDAKGRKIKVTKIHQPDPIFYKEKEVSDIDPSGGMLRKSHTRLPASYANFYLANNAVILPIFNDKKWDDNAIKTIKEVFPKRKVEPIYAREILLGGGNIHCITQQEPKKLKL